jgi:hypothetical protein
VSPTRFLAARQAYNLEDGRSRIVDSVGLDLPT